MTRLIYRKLIIKKKFLLEEERQIFHDFPLVLLMISGSPFCTLLQNSITVVLNNNNNNNDSEKKREKEKMNEDRSPGVLLFNTR